MPAPVTASAPAFTRDAGGYDATRRGLIPGFDAFYGAALDLIADWRGESRETFSALDLGAGTGLFAALLRARWPEARLHLVDASSGMLEEASRRFAGEPAVSFAIGDMARWTSAAGGIW